MGIILGLIFMSVCILYSCTAQKSPLFNSLQSVTVTFNRFTEVWTMFNTEANNSFFKKSQLLSG